MINQIRLSQIEFSKKGKLIKNSILSNRQKVEIAKMTRILYVLIL
jgi:hypothetical protein